MNKKSKWLLAVSLATVVTGSGIVMAATNNTDQQQGNPEGKGNRPHRAHHTGFGKMDNTALLDLLKIDAATLRSEFAAGKTLGQIAGEHGVAEQAVIELVKEQMTAHIDADVKAGRLTAEQGAQMKAGVAQKAEQMVQKGPGALGHRGPGMMNDKALLDLLKIDAATFRSDFAAGKTLSQIAGEHGVAEQAVIDLIKAQMTAHIDEGVKSGHLTAQQGEQMKAGVAQKVEQFVQKGPGAFGGPLGHRGQGMMNNTALLDLLKIDAATLRSEFGAGKTLSQIAGEHGVAEQAVINLVKEEMTTRIDQGVKAGRLTAEQGEKMKADAAQRAEQMVKNGPGVPGGPRGHHQGPGNLDNAAPEK